MRRIAVIATLAVLAWAASGQAAGRIIETTLYSPDSAAAGTAIATTRLPVMGASLVVFQWGNRDSTGFSTVYVDSFNSGGMQASMDGTTWSAGLTTTSAFYGLAIMQPTIANVVSRINNTACAGGRLTFVNGYNGITSHTIPLGVRYLRWTATVITRPRCVTCTGNGAMYRPFVKAFVIFEREAAGPYTKTPAGNAP